MGFNKGDIVRLKAGQQTHNRDFYGIDLEVVKDEPGASSRERLISVKKVGSDGTSWKDATEFFDWRLEKVRVKRVVGEKIAAADIKVGDTIHAEWVNDDLKLMREGVVARITPLGSLLTAGNRHIDISVADDTYTLIKAAPEVDLLLEKIKDTPTGGVVQFHLPTPRFARKGIFGWDIYGAGGVLTKSSAELAQMLRPLDGTRSLKWLS